ncbi:MAG TPA: methyltransferase domain-containing protein [Thermoanaerobaculia bacterium]|jgi:SAM-dependent methyltransferase|nr:methyltransferase domain-containing protein [Thermoanaerobaculia bacterium]
MNQETVRRWFDEVYATRGLSYLRPPEAYPIFVHLVGARPGEALLDVACGPGLLLKAAVERGVRGFGVDLSQVAAAMVPATAAGARAATGNAELLPFRDASFDCVTCIGSLERVLDREAALREMQRVARPGARFCLMVRNSRTLSWRVHAELLGRRNVAGHQDAAGLEQWAGLFERLGFTVSGVLPDQWLRQRLRRALGISWEAQRGRVARPILPLRLANEFIFLLRLET